MICSHDDPVFEDYVDKPVLANIENILYIIDGHHRMDANTETNTPTEVYIFTVK